MSSNESFYSKFYAIIEDRLGVDITPDNLDMDTSLHEGFNVDSLDFLELILEFEKQFKITIPDSDVHWSEQMTLQDLVNLVQAKMNGELYVPDKPMTQAVPVPVPVFLPPQSVTFTALSRLTLPVWVKDLSPLSFLMLTVNCSVPGAESSAPLPVVPAVADGLMPWLPVTPVCSAV